MPYYKKEQRKVRMDFNELIKTAHKNAVEKGFYDEPEDDETMKANSKCGLKSCLCIQGAQNANT